MTSRRDAVRRAAAGIGTLAMVGFAGWLTSRGMPADDDAETASVTTLLVRADDADPAVQGAAVGSLQRDHGRSPIAVLITLAQLRPDVFDGLNQPGRSARLDFLLASDDRAWTAAARAEAARALRALSEAAAAGRLRLLPADGERLQRLARRVGG